MIDLTQYLYFEQYSLLKLEKSRYVFDSYIFDREHFNEC